MQTVTVNCDIHYVTEPGDEQTYPTNHSITKHLIRLAVAVKWRETMPRTDSRIWGSIQRQLNTLDDTRSLIPSKEQFDWLYEVVDKTDLPPMLSMWLWELRDVFDALKSELRNPTATGGQGQKDNTAHEGTVV